MDSCLPDVHDQTQDIYGKVFQNRKWELFLILNHSVKTEGSEAKWNEENLAAGLEPDFQVLLSCNVVELFKDESVVVKRRPTKTWA